jgi:Zn-dependent peptidase ImmA (M78 family)
MISPDILFKAESLRLSWRINNTAPLNILSTVLENMDDLTILWFPMIDELSGCCAKTNQDKIICINSKHPKGRQNFTMAHELFHLLFDEDKNSFVCNVNSTEISEKKADKFAESLLIPDIALHEFICNHNIEKWKMSDVIKCEQYFQISHTAMLCKLRRKKMISFEEFKTFKKDVKRNAWELGYDLELYQPTRNHYSLGNIIPLSKSLYNQNKITGGKLDEILMDIFREDMVYNSLEEDDGFV